MSSMVGDVASGPHAAPTDERSQFEAFVTAHTPALLRTAYLLTGGDASAAEDVVQDTFARLYPRWTKVTNADHPLAYVRRTLVNTFLNRARLASAREVVVAGVDLGLDKADPMQAVADRDLLRRLIRRLPERQRAALVLHYLEDLSDRDVARQLGCRPGTARSLVSRALASLRADLGDIHD
jgi:RNA polymerase sigma-70 factor (sigma-E family)